MKELLIQPKCPDYFAFEYIVDGKIKVRFKFIFESSMIIDYRFESCEGGYFISSCVSQIKAVRKTSVKTGDGKIYFRQYFKTDKNKSLEENIALAKAGELEQIPDEIIKEYIRKPSNA